MSQKKRKSVTGIKKEFDVFLRNVFHFIVRDLDEIVGLPVGFVKHYTNPTVEDLRVKHDLSPFGANPQVFQAVRQITNFFDRWSFQKDTITPEDRKERSLQDFLDTQYNLSINQPKVSVVSLAIKEKLTEILGSTPPIDLIFNRVEFGRKAARGLPGSLAFDFSERMSALTGNSSQICLFREYILRDPILRRELTRLHGRRWWSKCLEEINSLEAIAVPKKYNIDRIITPNTVLGGFLSSGVGGFLEDCLQRFYGINLTTQPDFHQRLARAGSISGHLTTGDLTKASDFITDAHMKMLLPDSWYDFLIKMKIQQVEVDGVLVKTETHMFMGIGYTFPLQTLIFRVLLDVIAGYTQSHGSISVYGDDLIYPSRMHPYVKKSFEVLNFAFNDSKTYTSHYYDLVEGQITKRSDYYFRESCGGDYYHGQLVNIVRPKGSAPVSRAEQHRFLTILINQLHEQWGDEFEYLFHRTLKYIFNNGPFFNEGVILCDAQSRDPNSGITLHRYTVEKHGGILAMRIIRGQTKVLSYREKTKDVEVRALWPYYWLSMRESQAVGNRSGSSGIVGKLLREERKPKWYVPRPKLIWRKPEKEQRRYVTVTTKLGREVRICVQKAYVSIPDGFHMQYL